MSNDPNAAFRDEVLAGLSRPQKGLSPKWLYDERGSELFEEITEVKEYYPTRTEAEIFETAFPELAGIVGVGSTVVEYGSGSSKKSCALIEAIAPAHYILVDIAEEFVTRAAAEIEQTYGGSPKATAVIADFTDPDALPLLPSSASQGLGFFPGSTIGNLGPDAGTELMAGIRRTLGDGAYFLMGADLVKDTSVLEAAYDDAAGVTAAFNMNLLTRMNRELGADFSVEAFEHRALFNKAKSRIEMHLVSLEQQAVMIGDERFVFGEGETIHTENSYKFSVDSLEKIGSTADWTLEKVWTDPKDWYGVLLFKAT